MLLRKLSIQNIRGKSPSECDPPPLLNPGSSACTSTTDADISSTPTNPAPTPLSIMMSPSETKPIRYLPSAKQPLFEISAADPVLDTPHALFFHAAKKFPQHRCLAFRKQIAYVTEVEKMRKGKGVDNGILIKEQLIQKETVMLGDWEYKTYEEVAKTIRFLAAALMMKVDGRLHMFGRNSCWWYMLSLAASMSSIPLVIAYTKIGQTTLLETLTQTQSVAIFVDSDLLPILLVTLIECPHVKMIIYHPVSAAWKDLQKSKVNVENLRSAFPGVSVSSIDDFMAVGEKAPLNKSTTKAEDPNRNLDGKDIVWGIMYPLGDPKNKPKGVLVTSCNMVATIKSMKRLLKSTIRKEDTYLSYLPLCLMLEYTLVSVMMLFGLTIGFATKASSYLLPPPYSDLNTNYQGDIESFEPSILFGIPPWWDEIHAHVLEIIKENDQAWQEAFWRAVARKKAWLEHPVGIISSAGICTVDNTTWIRTVREKLFGTRVRWIGVSCAMEGPEKREFLGAVMSSSGKMVEGFSFMEMSTIVTFMPPQNFCNRTLGFPLPSLEMKLVTVAPHYIATSAPARGEIYIRGPSVPQMGFHANPEASVAAFLADGWVKTGDVGEWDFKNPGLRIIGRLKPLEGRFMGEFVAVERLEKAYEASNVVNKCCLVYSWRKTQPIALISASLPNLRKFANFHLPKETPGMSNDGLLLSIPVKALLLNELKIVARDQGCVDFEVIGGIIMTEAPLPLAPKPRRTKVAKMTQAQQRAADVEVQDELDRKAVAVIYSAETEVMHWTPLLGSDRALTQQSRSTNSSNGRRMSAPPPHTPKMVPRTEEMRFPRRRVAEY